MLYYGPLSKCLKLWNFPFGHKVWIYNAIGDWIVSDKAYLPTAIAHNKGNKVRLSPLSLIIALSFSKLATLRKLSKKPNIIFSYNTLSFCVRYSNLFYLPNFNAWIIRTNLNKKKWFFLFFNWIPRSITVKPLSKDQISGTIYRSLEIGLTIWIEVFFFFQETFKTTAVM